MSTLADITEWLKTTKVTYPGPDDSDEEGRPVRLAKYISGPFVVTLGDEEVYRGEDREEALAAYHKARGFPSGDPSLPRKS